MRYGAYAAVVDRVHEHAALFEAEAHFGGRNTGLRGGTFLKIKDGTLPSLDFQTMTNRPFNDFWLALAPAFGVDLKTLGNSTQYTGALPGVFA